MSRRFWPQFHVKRRWGISYSNPSTINYDMFLHTLWFYGGVKSARSLYHTAWKHHRHILYRSPSAGVIRDGVFFCALLIYTNKTGCAVPFMVTRTSDGATRGFVTVAAGCWMWFGSRCGRARLWWRRWSWWRFLVGTRIELHQNNISKEQTNSNLTVGMQCAKGPFQPTHEFVSIEDTSS